MLVAQGGNWEKDGPYAMRFLWTCECTTRVGLVWE